MDKVESTAPAVTPTTSKIGRYVIGIFLLAAFGAGIEVGQAITHSSATLSEVFGPAATNTVKIINKNAKGTASKNVDFSQFWDVWSKIQEKSVKRPIDEKQMYYGAVSGLVASLGDPYSVFFTPQVATEFQEELAGSFSGIGAEVGAKDGRVVVVAPLPDSPAERADVRAGDFINSVDGKATAGLTVDEVVKQIRGPQGTSVTLVVERTDVKEPIKIVLKREKIELKSVLTQQLPNNVLLVTVTSFNDQTWPQFNQAISLAQSKKSQGIVVDLRNNPGGFFETAIDFASEWLDSGAVVVSERGADKTKRQDYTTTGNHRLKGIPTVVLVNGGSASASEIVAGALQDQGKAKIIGTKSFGKGSVQEYEELPDGSALKLTIALWYTPKDRSINELGITPDITIDEKLIKDEGQQSIVIRRDVSKDVFIQRALQFLKSGK